VTDSEQQEKKRAPRGQRRLVRFLFRLFLLIVIPGAAALVGAYVYVTGQRYVSSENAFVKANKIAISPEVSGKVLTVDVQEHQPVHEGQVLFQIDDESYRIKQAEAYAALQKIRNDVESLRANYHVKQAELKLARDDFKYFDRTFQRREQLRSRGNVSEESFDQARRSRNSAQQNIIILQREIQQILAGLNGNANLKVEDYPAYLQAQAEYDQASLDLQHTVVRAPTSGRISKITLEPGEFVKSEEPLFAIISDKSVWVEANLKETQLTWVKKGQKATIEIDAYPDVKWTATVDSISPATGAEFAILPPQNATGNWVKVVQRLPVRLILDKPNSGPTLRAGMSALIEIDTEHEAVLPSFVQQALAWVSPQQ
jgi:membrane fusion protein (multidrug efflux system)